MPNPVPLWEPAYQPGEKGSVITICYTPSGKHEIYPRDHRLYWHSKGYATTIRVLQNLSRRFSLRLEIVADRQITHAESLAMKRRAHIVIDECVTGSYHRNSLEGVALGCVVVNGLGLLPEIADVFQHCAGPDAEFPFVSTGLQFLERVLTTLIEQGAEQLASHGMRNRKWMERNWDFEQQWRRFWESAIADALKKKRSDLHCPMMERSEPVSDTGAVKVLSSRESREGMSVVVCHGGRERLPQLSVALANLRQCEGVDEVIVVDMAPVPTGEEGSRRWADKYIFVRNDSAFERARSLNIGTAIAQYDLVCWCDNDLMMSRDFFRKAAEEMRQRELDYLIPHSRIDCLSEADTKAVIQGARNPADCTPSGVVVPIQGAFGGAGIVRRSFVLAYGGLPEGFKGWGGEDDAWWHKANVLGRRAVTRQQDQRLHHLYHLNSGSYVRQKESNPHYDANLFLLNEMCSVQDREAFLRKYPGTTAFKEWEEKCVEFVANDLAQDSMTIAIVEAIAELTGIHVASRNLRDGRFDHRHLARQGSPDAYVLYGLAAALAFLADEAHHEDWRKTIVIHPGGEPSAEIACHLQRAAALICLRMQTPLLSHR